MTDAAATPTSAGARWSLSLPDLTGRNALVTGARTESASTSPEPSLVRTPL